MIKQKIFADLISALKNHDQEKLSFLRYILAQIKNKEIDKIPSDPKGKSDLTDEEVVAVLRKITKELNESTEAYKKGNRQDLVKENQKQLEILSVYLPKELSDEDLKKEVEKIIQANIQVSQANPKTIFGICIKQLKSRADPARLVKILQSLPKP